MTVDPELQARLTPIAVGLAIVIAVLVALDVWQRWKR